MRFRSETSKIHSETRIVRVIEIASSFWTFEKSFRQRGDEVPERHAAADARDAGDAADASWDAAAWDAWSDAEERSSGQPHGPPA